jgi:lysophospholipase L1-like esterase
VQASGQEVDLFAEDGLHLDGDGYALWRQLIKPYVR